MKRLIYLLTLIQLSCSNQQKVDVSNIDINYDIIRYDSLLFAKNVNNYNTYFNEIAQSHKAFTKVFCENIYSLGKVNKDSFNLSKELTYLVTNPDMQNLFKETQVINNDLQLQLNTLNQSLKYFKYHFPEINTPDIYLYNGKFEYAAIVGQNFIGIAMEMCLGNKNTYIRQSGIPNYISRKLNLAHMPVHVMQNLIQSNFLQQSKSNLLDFMIYKGKVLYCLDAMLPGINDSLKIGYADEKIEWCQDNENEIWSWMLKHELLFNTQKMEFMKYVMDGPNTAGMPYEAPGNIASWLGWQIVSAYMEKHPNTSLKDLMLLPALQKGQVILNKSGYKPR